MVDWKMNVFEIRALVNNFLKKQELLKPPFARVLKSGLFHVALSESISGKDAQTIKEILRFVLEELKADRLTFREEVERGEETMTRRIFILRWTDGGWRPKMIYQRSIRRGPRTHR